MNPNESALSRWYVVPDATERVVDSSPTTERQMDGREANGGERAVGAGSERATFGRMRDVARSPRRDDGPPIRRWTLERSRQRCDASVVRVRPFGRASA